jgi:hypothetical protein
MRSALNKVNIVNNKIHEFSVRYDGIYRTTVTVNAGPGTVVPGAWIIMSSNIYSNFHHCDLRMTDDDMSPFDSQGPGTKYCWCTGALL